MMDVDVGAGVSDFDEPDSPPPQPKKRATKAKAATQATSKSTGRATVAKRKGKVVQVIIVSLTGMFLRFSSRLLVPHRVILMSP